MATRLLLELLLFVFTLWLNSVFRVAFDQHRLRPAVYDRGQRRLAPVRLDEIEAERFRWRAGAGVDLVIDVDHRRHQLHSRFERQLAELERHALVLSFWSKKHRNFKLLRKLLGYFRHLRLFGFQRDVQDRALPDFYGIRKLRGCFCFGRFRIFLDLLSVSFGSGWLLRE